MLESVLKCAVSRRGGSGSSTIPAEDGRYYSYEQTVRWLREHAESFRRSLYLAYP